MVYRGACNPVFPNSRAVVRVKIVVFVFKMLESLQYLLRMGPRTLQIKNGFHMGPKGPQGNNANSIPLFPGPLISFFLGEMQQLISTFMPGYSHHGPKKHLFPKIHANPIDFFTVAP